MSSLESNMAPSCENVCKIFQIWEVKVQTQKWPTAIYEQEENTRDSALNFTRIDQQALPQEMKFKLELGYAQ